MVMKRITIALAVFGLFLGVHINIDGAKGMLKDAVVHGNLRVDVVTCPERVAADFNKLNKQVLLYSPIKKMLDYILSVNANVDVNRIYCIGYRMGGRGTWEWAMFSPKRFAAIMPMAFIPDLSNTYYG